MFGCSTAMRKAARIVTLIFAISCVFVCSGHLVRAQSSATDWEKAAGEKMSFEVASVKRNETRDPAASNVPLGPGDAYAPNGGLFSATNFPLVFYISFAYKLSPGETQSLEAKLPKWANEHGFDVQARGTAKATKDQMRLMMQSLLTDRFKLNVHIETKESPIYALVLVKPRKLGPRLRPHPTDAAPCANFSGLGSPTPGIAGGLPEACGGFVIDFESHEHVGARNVTPALIATWITSPGVGALDRPVVDETGLTGTFDLTMDWAAPRDPNASSDSSEPTLIEALSDQLGLKLESKTRLTSTLVIDHIEEPSAN